MYGTIENYVESNKDNRIEVKIINIEKKLKYNVYAISNGRLYTDRIHDTAAILDNKIIEGPSFQLRQGNDHAIFNSNIKDNIVFTKGTPRKLKNLDGSVLSLLTGGGGNNNYWHWMYDVLPRISLCSRSVDLKEIDYFLIPSLLQKFQRETLDCLNIPEHKRLPSEKFRHIKAKKLIMTDHPVAVTGNATLGIQNIPFWIILWLKNNFLTENIINNKKTKNKIYIDRTDKKSNHLPQRSINNEEEVKEYLIKHNFSMVKLHETNFIDQVNLFHNAECIIGLHGAGFGNIVFCKPKTKIIELRSFTSGDVIKNLAIKNDLNYQSIDREGKETFEFGFPNQQGSITVPIMELEKAV